MKYLVLNEVGEIAAILNSRPDANALARKVPPEYPETMEWDAARKAFVASNAKAMKAMREQRDVKLLESDFPPVFERPLIKQLAWINYRQALRDLPTNTNNPLAPIWPIKPV